MAEELDKAIDAVFDEAAPQEAPIEAPAAVAPVETVTEPQAPEPAQTPEPPVAKEEHTVPLAKFLDQRDELKELRRFKQDAEAKVAAPANLPDPFDDPAGFAAHQETQFQARLAAQKFEMSDVLARQAHSPDEVDAALSWAEEKAKSGDQTFVKSYMGQPHPVDWIVRQHKRDGFVSQLPADVSSLDELVEREIARRSQSAVGQQQANTPAAPKPSLVNAPSSGGTQTTATGPLAGVEAVFPR